MKNLMKGSLFATAILLVISSNASARDYSGLNFSISANATNIDTRWRDNNGHGQTGTRLHNSLDLSVPGFSWSTGYDKKWDSALPFNRDLYTGFEIGGTYLIDDRSHGGSNWVSETHYRGHQVISGGIELGFNLGQGKVSFDAGAALANILNKYTTYSSGSPDYTNSPHTQDLVPGFYLGFEIEHLLTQNLGVKFGGRHYDFTNMEEQWFATDGAGTRAFFKYENTLTQAQLGLVYYFRQK